MVDSKAPVVVVGASIDDFEFGQTTAIEMASTAAVDLDQNGEHWSDAWIDNVSQYVQVDHIQSTAWVPVVEVHWTSVE